MDEDILRRFYEGVKKQCSLTDLEIPPSLVFYVRRAIAERTGVCYPVSHVYASCYLEGFLDPDTHFVNGLPQDYVDKFFGGKHPDMNVLRERLRVLYQRHLEVQSLSSAELMVDEADIGEVK